MVLKGQKLGAYETEGQIIIEDSGECSTALRAGILGGPEKQEAEDAGSGNAYASENV